MTKELGLMPVRMITSLNRSTFSNWVLECEPSLDDPAFRSARLSPLVIFRSIPSLDRFEKEAKPLSCFQRNMHCSNCSLEIQINTLTMTLFLSVFGTLKVMLELAQLEQPWLG